MTSRRIRDRLAVLCAGLAVLSGCGSPRPRIAAPPPAEVAATRPAEVAAARPAEVAAAPAAEVASAPAKNRDVHGNPDIARYIDILQSEARVTDLQVDVVLAKLALPADAVVGDLGCGPGVFSVAFAKACPNGIVFACDIEPAQLDQVREKIHAQGLRNVVPVLASADDPHFPVGRLDIVFIGDTYHHLDDRVAYMRRLQSVLKPGGRLVLFEYKPGQLPVGPPPEHKLAPGVLERELDQAGFDRVETFDTHPWHDFGVWRVRLGG